MNYRVKNIGIAVALAALAAILTSVYVVNYKRHVQNGEDKVPVFVAAHDIPAGTSGAGVVDQHMLKKVTVPRKAIVAGAVSSPDQQSAFVQLRMTDWQAQKMIWIQKNSEDNGQGWHLSLRPPNGSLDSANTYMDSALMLFDGPGRRPPSWAANLGRPH